jgi:meiotically up-regulated gene 157 (Mug157) protein
MEDYITADNAMMSVELDHLATMLDTIGILSNISSIAKTYSTTIRQAIFENTLTADGIYAYETNGYGGQYIMDDANVPSLLSLPYLGFLDRGDETYQKTKDAMFSSRNPYYAAGKSFQGVG